MKEYRTKAIINASADVVWKTITDLKAMPQFDPDCQKIEGKLDKYGVLKVYLRSNGGRVFHMRVKELMPNQKMVWESGWPLNLFKRVRTFLVVAKDDQTSEFHMEEVFSGYLFTFFEKSIPDLKDVFIRYSKSLKQYIESRP